jgi:hypothetical protein
MLRSILRSLLVLGALACLHGAPSTTAPISFNRDIRPIMSDTCFHCHGFDATTREAGMRLDVPEEALKPTKDLSGRGQPVACCACAIRAARQAAASVATCNRLTLWCSGATGTPRRNPVTV